MLQGQAKPQREQVLDKLNAGDPGAAAALLGEMMKQDGETADLLGLMGIALEEMGEIEQAADSFRRALDRDAETSITLRNVSNLAALLVESGRRVEASQLLRQGWRWPSDREPETKDLASLAFIADGMNMLRLHDEAAALLAPLAEQGGLDWPSLKQYITALSATEETDKALKLAENAKPGSKLEHERQGLLSYLYWRKKQARPAVQASAAYLTAVPPVVLPSRSTQKYTVGIIEPNPPFAKLISAAPLQHFTSNYPAMMARRQSDQYRFVSMFIGAGSDVIHQFHRTRPRVVINNVINSEELRSADNLEGVKGFMDLLEAPVINPPEQAARCTRQMNAAYLADISGLTVPKVHRFQNDRSHLGNLLAEIEESTRYPLIIRSTTEQEARNMTRVDGRAKLEAALRALPEGQFYCIEYIGEPRRDTHFRRIRAAFIDGTPLIVRADYAEDWIVRSRNKIPLELYRGRPDLLAEANAIIEAPERELGRNAMQALEAVGQKIPLDIFGMDFDVTDDGQAIFFEANASMNFFSNAPKEFPYPPQAEEMLSEALQAALDKRAGL